MAASPTPSSDIPEKCDADFAGAVINQHPQLQLNAPAVFPNNSAEVYEQLATALGFEQDTHQSVFPNVDVLWLDPTTQEDAIESSQLSRYWAAVLEHFQYWLSLIPITERSGSLLQEISSGVWSGTGEVPPEKEEQQRDNQFAAVLRARMESELGGWAVAILGAAHAEETSGSTVVSSAAQDSSVR